MGIDTFWIRLAALGLIAVAIFCDTASLRAQPTRTAGSPSVSLLLDEAIAHKERAEHSKVDAKIDRAYRLSQSLTDDDPRRLRADVAFAGLEVAKLLAVGNTDAAYKQAAASVERAETQKGGEALLAAGDYFRIQAQLNLAGVELQRRNLQQTLAICRKISALPGAAQVAKSQQAEAMILQAGVGILQKNWTAENAVDLVSQLQSMLPVDDPRLYQAQVWTFMTHAWSVAGLGQDGESAAKVDEALEALAGRAESLTEQLAKRGVHPAVASLGYLGLANAEYESRRLDRVPKSLGRLKIQDDPTRVAPLFRFTFHNLCGLLDADFSRFSAAGDHFGAAIKLSEQIGDPELRAVVSNNIGQLLLRQGDYPNARRYLQTAIKFYEVPRLKNHPGRPFAMVNYAKCLEYDDSLGEARELIEQALEIVKQSKDPSPAERHAQCLCLAAHGINAYSFGEPDIARQSFTELHELVVDLYGQRHLHTAEALVNLGWVDLEEKKYESARKRFETALAIISEGYGNEHPRAAEIMGYLARALVGMQENNLARDRLIAAIDLRESTMRRAFQTALSERDRLALVQEMRVHPESMAWPGVFDTFLELAPALGINEQTQYERVLSWKQVINRTQSRKAANPADEALLAELQREQQQVAQEIRALYFSEASLERQADKRRRIGDLEARFRDLERQVEAISGDLEETRAAASAQAVLDVLPPDTLLIDLIEVRRYRHREVGEPIADERLLIAYVAGGGAINRVDLGARDDLRQAVVSFRNALDRSEPDFAEPQRAVADYVQPLMARVQKAAKLFIVPDGDFHSMPWTALPGSKPKSYLVEEKSIVLLPHARRLVQHQVAGSPAKGLLVAGGVDYAGLKEWKPLQGSLTEAKFIAQLHKQVSSEPLHLLIDRQPSEQQLLSLMPRCRYVHLATHGFFSGDSLGRGFDIPELVSELESGLVTAPPSKGDRARDQFLTAQEIRQLDLSGVELVVLSACRTGLGTVKSGQGTVGLLAALERAGVEAAITTLWPVRDEETQAFMNAFYHHLWRNRLSPAAALRATQMNCIRGQIKTRAGGTLAHPKNWAGFVLTGTRH